MLKAVKVKLYPNNEQEIYINKLLGCYRFVYNQSILKKYSPTGLNFVQHGTVAKSPSK